MPPIWVLSNARWTSATKAPSVISARPAHTETVEGRDEPRPPVGLTADRGEREERVGRGGRGQREPGDHHRVAAQPRGQPRRVRRRLDLGRDEDRGEHDPGERDHARPRARRRSPAPPRSPAAGCVGRRAAGRAPEAPMASATAITFAASTGSHIAELSQMRSRKSRLGGADSMVRRPALIARPGPRRTAASAARARRRDPPHAQAVERAGERRQRAGADEGGGGRGAHVAARRPRRW